MANLRKFKQKDVVNILRHNAREIQNSRNPDIDPDRLEHNYRLDPDRQMSDYSYFKQRKNELWCINRKDVCVIASWIVTAPIGLPREKEQNFFQTAYDFLKDRYGEKNTIQAIVHADEAGQSHMHFVFIPVTFSEKRQCEKICAKERLDRQELSNFHSQFQSYMNEKLPGVKVKTGVTERQGRNFTIDQLKERDRDRDREKYRERSF